MDIYVDNTTYTEFKDDGLGYDVTAGDFIYTAYVTENIPVFKQKVLDLESKFIANGGVVHFTGHIGDKITNINHFDTLKFNNGDELEVSLFLMDAIDCEDDLLKQNSLFVTELSVVEDPARIYFVGSGGGNNVGVWTFGNLMKNICNESYTGIEPKEFLKRWLKRWTDTTVINGETIYPRPFVYNYLIAPWIISCGVVPSPNYNVIATDLDAWEDYWELCDEDDLLKYAPFRLMAIVNRMDLRGNMAYHATLQENAGETRFIYTLVAPFDMNMNNISSPSFLAGMPPISADGSLNPDCDDLLDWKGMNVIFEYGNPQRTRCEVKALAQAWADLSELALGSSGYNEALENITHLVIDANSNPLRTNNNKSCLNQLRTNERIFHPSSCSFANADNWADSDWELSQFELDSGYLVPAPVTNTPRNTSNAILDEIFEFKSPASSFKTTGMVPLNGVNSNAVPLLDWVYFKQTQVSNGNHNLPLNWTYNGNTFYLAGTARMDMEAYHYWDLNFNSTATTYYTNPIAPNSTGQEYAQNLRRQLSINTCQGCHGGENKTVFTQVRPLGYGQHNRYWLTMPDKDTAKIDTTRFTENHGANIINIGTVGTFQRNNKYPAGEQYLTRTSAFLTGRNYSGKAGSGTWQDDWIEPTDDGDDEFFSDNLFYVFSPNAYYNNGNQNSYLLPDTVAGFNDLQMRKQRLCQLLNIQCIFSTNDNSIVLATMGNISLVPFVE